MQQPSSCWKKKTAFPMLAVAVVGLLGIATLPCAVALDHHSVNFSQAEKWGEQAQGHIHQAPATQENNLRGAPDPYLAPSAGQEPARPQLTAPPYESHKHYQHNASPQGLWKKPKYIGDNTKGTSPQRKKHVQHEIRAGEVQSRGVNLGGWLLTEYWMTARSEMYSGISDIIASGGEQQVFTKTQPREAALGRFKWHRDNFINEQEIAKMASAGINTVRVPVGYWITGFDNFDSSNSKQWTNFAPGGLAYLDKLIRDWAKNHDIAVLISMHGAKGSQNGADHSAPEQPGRSLWSHYPENVASTLDAVKFLADRYKKDEAFLGIGLLNEPSGDTNRDVLYQYYQDAYKAIRHDAGNDCILTIAPLLWEQSPAHMQDVLRDATNVWVEWHRYFVWGWEQASTAELLGSAIENFRQDVENWKRHSKHKMYIGEFSFATAGKFTDNDGMQEFGRRQLSVLLDTVNGGWAFWSWRIYEDEYGANPWSLRSLIERGIFPTMTQSH